MLHNFSTSFNQSDDTIDGKKPTFFEEKEIIFT